MLEFQLYSKDLHRTACIEIFRSNIPKFFHEVELQGYTKYLDQYIDDNYWCAYERRQIVGSGGIWIRPDGIGRLVWGVIQQSHHRKGFGRQLLHFRLKKLASIPTLKVIQLDTSQHNPEFFKKFGFREFKRTEDHYAPGLHSHEMELFLTPDTRKTISDLAL